MILLEDRAKKGFVKVKGDFTAMQGHVNELKEESKATKELLAPKVEETRTLLESLT